MTHPVLPIALALGAALAYAAAAAIQRGQAAAAPGDSWRTVLSYLSRRPRWWAGLATMAVGAALHVAALGVGSVALVQPLGAVALVLALPLDARLSQRRVARGEWIGAGLVVAGLAALLAVAPRHDRRALPTPGPLLLTLGIAFAAVIVIVVATARARPHWRGVSRAAGAGVCMGTTSASAHLAIAAFVRPPGSMVVGVIGGAVALALPVIGLILLQLAYRDGGLDGPLGTLTITDPVIATGIGLSLFGERTTHGAIGVAVAAAGAALALTGLTMLVHRKPTPSTPVQDSPHTPSGARPREPLGHRPG